MLENNKSKHVQAWVEFSALAVVHARRGVHYKVSELEFSTLRLVPISLL
jgi:hypothetical protein